MSFRQLHPITIAARAGDLDAVKRCLKAGTSLEYTDPAHHGSTPLHVACERGHKSLVSKLLKMGANIECARNNGATPLFMAAAKEKHAVVELLLSKGAKVDAPLHHGPTPLYVAAQNGDEKMVATLLNAGADINIQTSTGACAVLVAAYKGRKSMIKYLCKHGANPALAKHDGTTALHHACTQAKPDSEHADIVKLLLDNGVDANHQSVAGVTALQRAIENRSSRSIAYLMASGAELGLANDSGVAPIHLLAGESLGPGGMTLTEVLKLHKGKSTVHDIVNLSTKGGTPLIHACTKSRRDNIIALLEAGADINAPHQTTGFTPLFTCCKMGRLDCANALLEAKSPPDLLYAVEDGATAFFVACQNGYGGVVSSVLKSAGTDEKKKELVDKARHDGVTPLMIACFGRHNGVVQLLLEHADVTRRDNEKGFDALYVAAQKSMDNVVADLVSAGADVNGKTKDGFTPLHISAYYRSAAMLSLLLALGADANEPIESDGSTAIAIAAWNGSAKCVEVLLSSSSVHLKLKDGTPLIFLAVESGNASVVKALVAAGCSLEEKNPEGQLPLDVAIRMEKQEVILAIMCEQTRE